MTPFLPHRPRPPSQAESKAPHWAVCGGELFVAGEVPAVSVPSLPPAMAASLHLQVSACSPLSAPTPRPPTQRAELDRNVMAQSPGPPQLHPHSYFTNWPYAGS